jgi:hypothetical protein
MYCVLLLYMCRCNENNLSVVVEVIVIYQKFYGDTSQILCGDCMIIRPCEIEVDLLCYMMHTSIGFGGSLLDCDFAPAFEFDCFVIVVLPHIFTLSSTNMSKLVLVRKMDPRPFGSIGFGV